MFCGARSFSYVDKDPASFPSTPRKSSKKTRDKNNNNDNNPYSTRGLDKFATVMAELEARRQKIMAQAGSQGVSMVRFMYRNSQDWIPIVIKLTSPGQEGQQQQEIKRKAKKSTSPVQTRSEISRETTPTPADQVVVKPAEPMSEKKTMKKSFSWGLKGKEKCKEGCREKLRVSYYWPVVVVLILVCLTIFGRTFAIFCTSVWWYMVPIIRGEESGKRRSMKKRDYGRWGSEKNMGGGGGGVPSAAQVKKMGGVQRLTSPRGVCK